MAAVLTPSGLSMHLLDTIIRTTVILALSLIFGFMLKKHSAATRHFVRAVSLFTALLLPLLSFVLPVWRVKARPTLASAPEPQELASLEARTAPATRNHQEIESSRQRSTIIHHSKAAPIPVAVKRDLTLSPTALRALDNGKPSSGLPLGGTDLFVAVWLIGAILFSVHLLIGAVRLSFLLGKTSPINDPAWTRELLKLSRGMRIRRTVTLARSNGTDVPLTAGIIYPQIILPAECDEWEEGRWRAILQHELAHIKRFDILTQWLAQFTLALYWFNPLAWFTIRAMRVEGERACDDYVLAAGIRPSDYAHELLDIVSGVRQPQLMGALAMARHSQLEGRILALLNPSLSRASVSRRFIAVAILLSVCIVVPIAAMRPEGKVNLSLPANSAATRASTDLEFGPLATKALPEGRPSQAFRHEPATKAFASTFREQTETLSTAQSAQSPAVSTTPVAQPVGQIPDVDGCVVGKHHSNYSSHQDDGRKSWTATWSGENCDIDMRSEGTVTFNAEATEITSISPDGYFEVNERIGDNLRRLKVTGDANGQPSYALTVNTKQQSFDASARTWFASFLVSLERTTGFAADSRVPALLKKGGPAAVLAEINNLRSDFVRSVYFRKLLENATLTPQLLLSAINQAAQQINSDFALGQVLMEIGRRYDLADEASRAAFLSAANHLKSAFEHSRVLLELLQRPNISPETVRMALNSAGSIRSDFEKSRILVKLAGFKSFDDKEISEYLELVSSIQSDFERSRCLMALIRSHNISPASMHRVLEAATMVRSDFEKSHVLIAASGMENFDEHHIDVYLKIVDSIGRDFERGRSLTTLLQQHKLSNAAVAKILESTSHLKTDFEKSRVLQEAAKRYPMEGLLRESYIRIAESISSEFERNRALAAVVRRASL